MKRIRSFGSVSFLYRWLVIALPAMLCFFLTACGGSDSAPEVSVVINEVMSSNSAFAVAADGKYYDWVELHNPSDIPVSLDGCWLTDNESAPRKLSLSDVVIEPHGYALVYISGLGCTDEAGYLHASFRLSAGGETLLLSNGRGDVLSRADIPKSPANVSYGLDSAGNYVWFSSPTPLGENSGPSSDDPDTLDYTVNGVIINEFMPNNTYTIYDSDGDCGDWVELLNPTGADADMSHYALSDEHDSPSKWSFPSGTVIPAGGYMLIYCDGKDTVDSAGVFHTGFSLGADDEAIMLFSNQGILCSEIVMADMPENVSCGFDANGELRLFARPTPGRANDSPGFELTSRPEPDINNGVLISEVLSVSGSRIGNTSDYIEILNATSGDVSLGGYALSETPGEAAFTFPEMILPAGGYAVVYCDGYDASAAGSPLHAAMKIKAGGETIYLKEPDGRICDCFSTGLSRAGCSSGRSGGDLSTRCIFTSPTPGKANGAPYYAGYAPAPVIERTGGYVEVGTEVAITVPEGCEVVYTTNGAKPTASSTRYTAPITVTKNTVLRAMAVREGYLNSQCVTETYLVEDRHSVSTVSLSSAPEEITGAEGFLVNVDSGIESEAHVEYFDENGRKCFEFDAGASIFGQYSRTQNQKGIKLLLRESFGVSEITYPLFPDSVSGVSTFSSLLLRPCGQDQTRAKLRDELVPAIVRGMTEVDYQEFRPCALHINGRYWGLYYIRERLDADYIERRCGYAKGSFDLIKSQCIVQEGSIDAWNALDDYCRTHDLTQQSDYEYVCSQVDIESLIDFWIIETYFANTDTGNVRCYKTADGKWHWMIYDFDWAMTPATWREDYIFEHLLDPGGHGSAGFSNAMMRNLLKNGEFRDRFISRYCYHINNTFAPDRVTPILDSMAEAIADEIPRQYDRWSFPAPDYWESSVEKIRDFLTWKPDLAVQQLRNNFGISKADMEKYLKDNK